MKLFIDTNIIIDLLGNREPFSKFAVTIFSGAEQKRWKLYTSSHAIATAYYLLKHYGTERELRRTLLALLDLVEVIAVDETVIRRGLHGAQPDFEDAVQVECARKIRGVDYIITRNVRDFKKSPITIAAPDAFCLKYA